MWNNLKKIYFENPPILCSIATAVPENANEQHSNQFWLKKFHFIFWPQAAGADLWKNLKKNIFWKSTNFMFNSNSRPSKCKRTEFESILVEKVSFHFLAQGHRRGPVKSSEKDIFWKSTNVMFNSNSRPWKCKRTELESILVEKVSFHFLAQGRRRGPVKKSEKNIFWKSTNFMFNSNSRPWKCKRTALESILAEKISFHFLASGRRRGPVKKSDKNIFWKSTNFMFNSNSRPSKCKRTEFESILVEKVSFHFLAQGHRRGPVKSSEKDIFWKSTNFMFNSNSRPWKCKRTELESILVEKVSFHFLAQGRRRGPVKSSEKDIFWKSTNFMFNSNSRPWKCKRTALESILAEKVSFLFLASGCRRGPVIKSEKNIFWKSTNFMFNSNSRPWKCKRIALESILVEKVSFHFLALERRRGPVKKSEKKIFWKSTNFMFNSKSRPWKCKRTDLQSILVENISFNFLAQGRRRGPAQSSEKNIFENPQILCWFAKAGPEYANEQHSNRFWLKEFHFIFWP